MVFRDWLPALVHFLHIPQIRTFEGVELESSKLIHISAITEA